MKKVLLLLLIVVFTFTLGFVPIQAGFDANVRQSTFITCDDGPGIPIPIGPGSNNSCADPYSG